LPDVLAVFAKAPEPGRVKTRLAKATTREFAAQVATAFLHDTLDRLAGVEVERWLVHDPAGADLAAFAQGRWQCCPQGEGDIGQRLERFVTVRLTEGSQRVVIIGADSPTMPIQYIHDALAALEHADVVLGPANDGGYYLLGLAGRAPPIFTGVRWGTSAALRDTIARLSSAGKLALTPPWYDVDTLDDWRMLQGHVAALRRAGIDPGIPHTERLLHQP
jgi:rSAM/selenodomain-associated transferase 1